MEVTTDAATLHNLGERCETQPSLAFLGERDDMEACLAVHTPELGIELILPDINKPIDVARYFNLLDHCLSGRGESRV